MFKQITFKEAMNVITNREPKGLFFIKEHISIKEVPHKFRTYYVVIDNRGKELDSGKRFYELNKCIRYLKSIGA